VATKEREKGGKTGYHQTGRSVHLSIVRKTRLRQKGWGEARTTSDQRRRNQVMREIAAGSVKKKEHC